MTTIAGSSKGYSSGVTTGCAARFSGPRGLALVGSKLYVADRDNARIRTVVLP